MDPLRRRRLPLRLALGAVLLAAASILGAAPTAGSAAGAEGPAALGALPADADVLYVAPAEGVTPAALEAALRAAGADVVDAREGARVRVPAGVDPRALASRLAGDARLFGLAASVEADAVISTARAPGDPAFAGQRAYLETIRAPEAWEVETGSDRVVIAVIDSGIDYRHPDLAARLFRNPAERIDGRDEDGNGCVDDVSGCNFVSLATADPSCGYRDAPPNWRATDDEGHGTFVAGLAAAAGNNGRGIAGIAWEARILPVKVLDCTATGRISDAAAGIRYAARMGADVITISFGAVTDSLALRQAVEFAQARGAIIVASAGNDGRRGLTYPARYASVVSVAASGVVLGDRIDYRSTAPFAQFGDAVDLLAPGVSVLSTVPRRLCGQRDWSCTEAGPYAVASGSSFATPIVAGALALIRARYPDLPSQFVALLLLFNTQPAERTAEDGVPLLDVAAPLQRRIYGVD